LISSKPSKNRVQFKKTSKAGFCQNLRLNKSNTVPIAALSLSMSQTGQNLKKEKDNFVTFANILKNSKSKKFPKISCTARKQLLP